MTENDASLGLFIRLGQGRAQLAVCLVVDRIALVGTVQTNQRDIVFEFIGDELVGHISSLAVGGTIAQVEDNRKEA